MKFTPRKLIAEDELVAPKFDSNRTYDAQAIIELIENSFVLEDQNRQAFLNIAKELDIDSENPEIILDDICQDVFLPTWSLDDEMEADELSSKLVRFAKYMKFNQEELNDLAEAINHTRNPVVDRQTEFNDDIESDISTVRYALDNAVDAFEELKEKVTTFPAQVRINKAADDAVDGIKKIFNDFINDLKSIQYSGNKNETWKYDTYASDKNKYKLIGNVEED